MIADAYKQGGQEPSGVNRGEPARNYSLLLPADQGIPRMFVRFLAWVSTPAGVVSLNVVYEPSLVTGHDLLVHRRFR